MMDIQHRLQEMTETELTKNILKPLFHAIGFTKVDIHHGPYEGGKDIVLWRKDELGCDELAVAQVKKISPTARMSDSKSFAEIVNQLQVAAEELVPHTDGKSYRPYILYFITPFPIDTRALEMRFEKYSSLRSRNVKIIDGPILTELLQQHLPELAANLSGTDAAIREVVSEKLNNTTLLAALDYRGSKDISSLYSDLNLSIESAIWAFAMKNPAKPCIRLNMSKEDWQQLYSVCSAISKKSGLSIPCQLCNNSTGSPFTTSNSDIRKNDHSKSKNIQTEVPEEEVEVAIDCDSIYEFFQNRRDWLLRQISMIDDMSTGIDDLRSIFMECNELFRISRDVLQNKYLVQEVITFVKDEIENKDLYTYRVKISLERVLETKLNVAVYGEAGAGKTTCLQMMARRRLSGAREGRTTFFLPLASAVTKYKISKTQRNDIEPLEHLLRCITAYLQSENVIITLTDLKHLLREKETLLLLDGIDEIIGNAPWILDATDVISEAYPKVQVVLSARIGGQYLSRINFVGFTLLPFTPEQREKFIHGWFKNSLKKKREHILGHLATHSDLADIVRSPLLATILCVLAENDVPLPNTEIRLYAERTRLLLGHYDIYKQAYRIDSPTDILEFLCQELAYMLHLKGLRSLNLTDLLQEVLAIEGLGISTEVVITGINELIHPCNILVPMGLSGEYGFGHLRFQEYFAALELNHNRGIDLVPLMHNRWWYGILLLFSRLAGNGTVLLDHAIEKRCVASAYTIIELIMEIQPLTEEQESKIEESIRIEQSLTG